MAKIKFWALEGVETVIKGTYKNAKPNFIEAEDGTPYPISGKNKGFDSEEEAEDELKKWDLNKNLNSVYNEKEGTNVSENNDSDSQNMVMQWEQDEIDKDNGQSWKKYLQDKINISGIPEEADAICFVDGSFGDTKMRAERIAEGSFGIIIVPIHCRKKEDCIIESSYMIDTSDKINFEQIFYDKDGNSSSGFTTIKLDDEVIEKVKEDRQNRSYLGMGWAESMEFEGAYRLLDLCIQNKFKNIYVVCDCDNVLKRISGNEDNTASAAITRFMKKYKEFKDQGGKAYAIEVGSHNNARIDRVEEPCKKGDNWFKGNRFCHAMNDMVDLMAKAELSHKNGGAPTAAENKPLVHLLPCKTENDGLVYVAFKKNSSDIKAIYDKRFDEEARRMITREFCKRLMPLIEEVRK